MKVLSDVRANGALDLTVAWSFQRMTLAALPARGEVSEEPAAQVGAGPGRESRMERIAEQAGDLVQQVIAREGRQLGQAE